MSRESDTDRKKRLMQEAFDAFIPNLRKIIDIFRGEATTDNVVQDLRDTTIQINRMNELAKSISNSNPRFDYSVKKTELPDLPPVDTIEEYRR